MVGTVLAIVLSGASLLNSALGSPVPQASSSCTSACALVSNTANSCSNVPDSQLLSCICGTSGFLSAAANCLACADLSSSQSSAIQQIQQACSASGSTIGGGGVIGPATSVGSVTVGTVAGGSSFASGSATASSSVARPASTYNGTAARVTGTAPVTISAWAGLGANVSLHSYKIAATGGINTTIEAIYTSTTTLAGGSAYTGTVTLDYVLGPTAILGVAAVDGASDVLYCQIGGSSGQLADCEEVLLQGTSIVSATEYSVTGRTTAWIAYPVQTGNVSRAVTSAAGVSSATATITSGSAAASATAASAASSAASAVNIPVVSGLSLGI